jgi:hypothetical protein
MSGFNISLFEPGDVIAVRTSGFAGGLIRWGEALRGWPNLDNHIVIVDSVQNGVLVGIEGRPGGVGRVDVSRYFSAPYAMYAVSTREQPKTDTQRSIVVEVMRQMLKVGYDWEGIAQDALIDLGIPQLWDEKWHGTSPAHVVCSSLAAWGYHRSDLLAPQQEDMRHIEPANWTQFCLEEGWRHA